MKATIDSAGRLVIPKPIRDHLGLAAGEVEVVTDGAALRVEPVTESRLTERGGRLVIPAGGGSLSDDDIQMLRDSDQR